MKIRIGQVYRGRISNAPFVVVGLNGGRALCRWLYEGNFDLSVLSLMDTKKYYLVKDPLYSPSEVETRTYDIDIPKLNEMEMTVLKRRFPMRGAVKSYDQLAQILRLAPAAVATLEESGIKKLLAMTIR